MSRPGGSPQAGVLGGLLRRLPILLVAALGIWLWSGAAGLVPTDRTVSFRFAAGAPVTRVDVQLYDAEGHLLAQQDRALRAGEPLPEISLKVQARPGMLQARLFRWRSPGTPSEGLLVDVPLAGAEASVMVDVPAAAR